MSPLSEPALASGWVSGDRSLVSAAPSVVSGRVASIDIMRGLAIVAMAVANAAGMLLELPHPMPLRLFGGIAAPTFVTLAGMMVAMAALAGRRGGLFFVRKAAFLLFVAAVLDASLTGWLPFVGFDVLYLVAASLPLCYLLARASAPVRWLVPIAIFALTPVVQAWLGYRVEMPMVPLETPISEWGSVVPDAARRMLVDGWFPLFPWLGFALFGVALETWRRDPKPRVRLCAGPGIMVLGTGVLVWLLGPGELAVRKGYSEPFYPSTMGFILTSLGILLVLLPTTEIWAPGLAGRMLERLGRCSLFLYVAHLVLLERVWLPLVGQELELVPFLNVCVALLLTLWGLASWFQEVRHWRRERRQAAGPRVLDAAR